MHRLRAGASALVIGCALWLPAACGPSVQSIYEGNVRFEHCYRLDLDLEIVPTHRRHCWEQWLDAYRQGQPRDRVEYARRRLQLFSNGDFERPVLRIGSGSGGHAGESATPASDAQPEPTSLRAPPPALARGDEPLEPPAVAVPTQPTPGAACASECLRARSQCQQATCADGSAGAAGGPACAGCDADYKGCMRRCFEQ